MKNNRSIAAIGSAIKRTESFEFMAMNVSSANAEAEIDPVISIDHFKMRAPVFSPHPHAGFCAVTYLFEDSEGDFISRDSTGGYFVSSPGGVIWNVAGSGIIHDEYPKVTGELSHGLQMFINLSSVNKFQTPQVLFVNGNEMPVYRNNGATVRVIAGSAGDVKAKIQPPENITFLDIRLSPNSSFEKTLPADEQVLLYLIDGSVYVGDEYTELKTPQTATFNFDGSNILLTTTAESAHLVLVAGKPHHEPLVSYGSFIMNTQEQIRSAILRYQKGEMGVLNQVNYK